jgi:hypothetical protein
MIGESNLTLGAIVSGEVLNGHRLEVLVEFIEDDIVHDELRQE